jgi:hypothetical protein
LIWIYHIGEELGFPAILIENDGMARNSEHMPGDPAPKSGLYRLLNIFGNVTHISVHAQQGQPLPGAPRGYGWRLDPESDRTDE